ncbi:hypothetical protein [Bacillus cereus]|uniref:hypothetical protein n=1 Tax=Bacillus cereus TaxID=1396 RepID=UPI0037345822
MTNTLLDTLKNFIDFINPEGAKSKEIQENITRSHIDAANIYCRNINELSAQFNIEQAYKVEIHAYNANKKEENYHLHLQKYTNLSHLKKAFLNGMGELHLLDLEEKIKVLPSTYIFNEHNIKYKAIETRKLVPDFLYTLDDEEYCVTLKPIHTDTSKKELQYELQNLYKTLYLSLNKEIDIDSNFQTSTCYESKHILRYFRLNQNSLFLVVEDLKGNMHHHTFKNINEIKHGLSGGGTQLKFWIYMYGDTYRFYLPYDEKAFKTSQVPLDQEIFKMTI